MKNLFGKLKQPKTLKKMLTILVVVLVIAGLLFYTKKKDRVAIENSVVSAPVINIAPATAGKLSALNVYEDETVSKGDPLMVVNDQTTYADTDGLIIMANNTVGGMVGPQAPVVQMINPADIRVVGTLDENKGLKNIKVGQVVSFTVDAYPGKTYWGYVDEVAPTAKQTQLSFSISSERPTQQFEVYARFDTTKYPEIKNGMSAKMIIFTSTK